MEIFYPYNTAAPTLDILHKNPTSGHTKETMDY